MRALTLLVWSLVLTTLTGILGAAPLKVLKEIGGRRAFWGLGLAAAAGLLLSPFKGLGLLYLCLVILIGLYLDFEERGHTVLDSGFWAVVVTSLLSAGGFALWMARVGSPWRKILLDMTEEGLAPVKQLMGATIEPAQLLAQAPSGVVIFFVLALFVAVVMEDRVRVWMRLPAGINHHLSWFRLPDVYVWPMIVALYFALTRSNWPPWPWLQPAALNVLNVLIVLYFLQGLAVIVKTFELLRVSTFWQILYFALILPQMCLFVSGLGLMDYWLNFRVRLSRKATEWNKKENY